ncbi:MarR family transcriptional regulator [Rhodobacterales bacterium HKCCE2091]|nr:MarR family transcriptional regulator [Rhodobacterales bacterium HKCCE2091]
MPAPVDLSDFLPFQMAVVSQRLAQALSAESGLPAPEWRILMSLPAHAPCSSGELCALTSMDPARVSRAQARLLESGLIAAVQDDRDRRRLVVTLTAKGRDEAERLSVLARKAENAFLAALEPPERDRFRAAIALLYSRI